MLLNLLFIDSFCEPVLFNFTVFLFYKNLQVFKQKHHLRALKKELGKDKKCDFSNQKCCPTFHLILFANQFLFNFTVFLFYKNLQVFKQKHHLRAFKKDFQLGKDNKHDFSNKKYRRSFHLILLRISFY
jgi:hypothetical protein